VTGDVERRPAVDGPSGDVLRRLERVEALESIRQLPARYATYVDARDIDALLTLYVDDCPVGDQTGLDALRERFESSLGAGAPFRATVHLVGNHVIDFDDDPDRARGVVYCRAEHEFPDRWVVAALQYWDEYERRGSRWLFRSRRLKAFYATDVLERPNGPERVKHQLTAHGVLSRAELPEAWPSWSAFWSGQAEKDRTS
jgi:SnoaL-like domain